MATGVAYALLADLVLLIHVGFILFATFGPLLAWRWRQGMAATCRGLIGGMG
jgi:hypothetical protein